MSNDEIINKLKPIITTYAPVSEALDNLNEDSDFIKDLNINSANLVDIILDVEEAFGITIDNTSMEKMLTVKASIEVIKEKLSKK
ncbi:acyl carrier protein [Pedobacter sp. CFBP9032]|uniref:acyl carrier protein n=1 Tax=Pedobacter sp. CFBP9032 TaxID=3096539 RepID=UPI002A69D700|nr:phosphopantetheine-binding protein [Pedobacter sp. CFBP9032]MDY0903398.1 phosphopantetheine-binding protein [Pedobacter sp. CFBP9032]